MKRNKGNKAKLTRFDFRLYVLPLQTRVLVVLFGEDAEYLNNAKRFQDWRTGKAILIKNTIGNLRELSNITTIHKGLETVFAAYKEGIKDRKDVPNILIIFTDGKTHDEATLYKVLKSKVRNYKNITSPTLFLLLDLVFNNTSIPLPLF